MVWEQIPSHNIRELLFHWIYIGRILYELFSCIYKFIGFIKQDIYGRRIIYIISSGITTLGIIGITTSISIYQYCVFNLIMGFGALPTYILNYVILNESSGTRFRQTSSIILLVFFINVFIKYNIGLIWNVRNLNSLPILLFYKLEKYLYFLSCNTSNDKFYSYLLHTRNPLILLLKKKYRKSKYFISISSYLVLWI